MKQIIIYHTNDTHARISTHDDDELSLGLDKISKLVNKSLLKNKCTYFFHAGDLIHGTPRINISEGKNIINILNPINLNALCLGNHEWNFGSDKLIDIVSKLRPYVLCANAVYKDTKQNVFLPYMIFEADINNNDYLNKNANSNNSKDDNIKIGVFGLITPETTYKTNPDNIINIEFLNPILVGKNMVKLLQNNCDIIIALTHLGLDNSSEFTSERLVKEVDGIDICIDGHSHSILPNGLKVNNTLIVQAGSHDHYLGKMILNIENRKIINIQSELLNEEQIDKLLQNKTDTFIQNKLNKIDSDTDKLLNKQIAYSNITLSGERSLVRCGENELGNLAANACKYITKAALSIVNGGDIRTSLLSGPITYKSILAIFPFRNNIHVYEITGKQIREMLEHSVEFVPAAFGGFLTVSSNVQFIYNTLNKPKHRIEVICINNELLDDNKIYTISMSSFLAAGGDDYQMLKGLKKVGEFDTIENIFVQYINEKGINEKDYKLGRIIVK